LLSFNPAATKDAVLWDTHSEIAQVLWEGNRRNEDSSIFVPSKMGKSVAEGNFLRESASIEESYVQILREKLSEGTTQQVICVTLLYPNKEGARFDWDHYLKIHIPMGKKVFGDRYEIRRAIAAVDGSPAPFLAIVRLFVDSREKFLELITQQGAALLADMPNYTNIEPVLQFDEIVT
jgi:uncharacterized protein (TIGR02118 family)